MSAADVADTPTVEGKVKHPKCRASCTVEASRSMSCLVASRSRGIIKSTYMYIYICISIVEAALNISLAAPVRYEERVK